MNFDKLLDRTNTNSLKWDYTEKFYGAKDIVPMWVADSDFEVPEEVKAALVKRAQHGAYGYTIKPQKFYDAICGWVKKKYGWEIGKDNMAATPGIVAAINWAVQAFTQSGDKIIVQSPVYYPFFSAVEKNGRILVDNTLILENGRYRMDFEKLEEQIDDKTKMIILCSPHNPVTRVWTRDELKELGEICTRKGVLIISDEIHSDLVFEGNKHTPIATISDEIAANTITLMAPSKTFNVAGLETSVAIFTNEELKKKFTAFQQSIGLGMTNIFGIEAFTACYEHGESWLEEQLVYIRGNVEYIKDFAANYMPKLNIIDPEGTYLLWMDCSCLKLSDDELSEFFVKKVKVALDMGVIFGKESGKNFIRFNLATQRQLIEKVMNEFKKYYDIRMSELA